jgi:hypothetical protein
VPPQSRSGPQGSVLTHPIPLTCLSAPRSARLRLPSSGRRRDRLSSPGTLVASRRPACANGHNTKPSAPPNRDAAEESGRPMHAGNGTILGLAWNDAGVSPGHPLCSGSRPRRPGVLILNVARSGRRSAPRANLTHRAGILACLAVLPRRQATCESRPLARRVA